MAVETRRRLFKLRYLPVAHEGCRQSSAEEAGVVVRERRGARGVVVPEVSRLCDAGVAASEIMVVAPFNAHVALLREGLPDDVRVGTVDKFQGQETGVVMDSTAASRRGRAARLRFSPVAKPPERRHFTGAVRGVPRRVAPHPGGGLSLHRADATGERALCRFAEIATLHSSPV